MCCTYPVHAQRFFNLGKFYEKNTFQGKKNLQPEMCETVIKLNFATAGTGP